MKINDIQHQNNYNAFISGAMAGMGHHLDYIVGEYLAQACEIYQTVTKSKATTPMLMRRYLDNLDK